MAQAVGGLGALAHEQFLPKTNRARRSTTNLEDIAYSICLPAGENLKVPFGHSRPNPKKFPERTVAVALM